ncbi:MAG: putative ABC transporter [Aureobasidium pullulans]|uniref:Mitochondrial carrier n=1 Tax=Aureobasidium pullulans TaxID=5580 RepID=A0A1A7MH01_AURPU|nr:MAG: putative ABC transporter [Aureobasidium pullulans]THZ50130.1 hypothetical protein D6C90_02855 [Aureobasidium pullulans]
MSADFWAGYVSGAAGIIIGNPLDIVKVNLQRGDRGTAKLAPPITTTSPILPSSASSTSSTHPASTITTTKNAATNLSTLLKGTAAPILGYGALNALMFMTYNRCMASLDQDPSHPTSLSKTWIAGALGGLATFLVSAPTELIKCRAQVSGAEASSWGIARELWKERGLRGLYWGGGVTSLRDSVGYGFYFWSYELSKRVLISEKAEGEKPEWMTILLCGGIAGVVTWASVFPLDVIKTRVQTQGIAHPPAGIPSGEQSELLPSRESGRLGTIQIARQAYREEGLSVFFRGLGVCSFRAFFVNAVQWAVYEWMMHILLPTKVGQTPSKHD